MKSKLPKARKLPSGRWNVIVTVKGERISITEDTEKLAQAKAVSVKAGLLNTGKKPQKLTLSDAIDQYIDSKSEILSPSTIRGYQTVKKHRFKSLLQKDIHTITRSEVQRAVNEEAKVVSPKTVYNAYGLIRPVLKDNGIDVFGIKLPQQLKKKPPFVQPEELARFVDALDGDECRLPIVMALWLGLRRSEILGLCWDCVDFNRATVTVRRVLVPDENNQWVLRDGAKNESSQRTVSCPPYIMEQLETVKCSRLKPSPTDRIFRFHPDTIRRHVHRACERAGITDTTIHGLRHTNAAVMRHIGISDDYAMERGGWTNERTYKETYSYVFDTAVTESDRRINEYFSEKLQTKNSTEK